MSTDAAPREGITRFEQLRLAREVLLAAAGGIQTIAGRLGYDFCRAAELVACCDGAVVVTGVGKAGLVGQKLSATLASTGSRSLYLHPSEAAHGDLGRVSPGDVAILMSYSGESLEVVRLLASFAELRVPMIAMTRSSQSSIGRQADVVIELGAVSEACPLGLAPTTSTTVMAAMGDALALVASSMRGFTRDDFARIHPAGSLGKKLARVEECMRSLAECRMARQDATVREVFGSQRKSGRRSGAILLVDEAGVLRGLFTDSDLARLFESRCDAALDQPIRMVMSAAPITIQKGSRLEHAIGVLSEHKISELPVVDAGGRPLGILDVTDVIARAAA